jgi:glycopeptide antibiotics resistance protein
MQGIIIFSQNMNLLKFIFYISIILLIFVSLFPGSILGHIFYGDATAIHGETFSLETTINHFLSYIYISSLGMFIYYKNKNYQKIFFYILFLSIILEFLQLYIPNRSFQTSDLFANVMGVLIGHIMIKIFKIGRKNE